MNRLIQLQSHPFRLLLHLEWILLGISLLLPPHPVQMLQVLPQHRLLSILSIVCFGVIGLWLPTLNLFSKVLYTGLGFGLILLASVIGGKGIDFPPPLLLILVIRSCLVFNLTGRLLVDDQIIIRQGLKSLLESKPDFEIVGEAENGKSAISILERLAIAQVEAPKPDVVLMDVRMPIMDGVAATEVISQQFPDVKVLVLTTFDDDEYISQAMRFGARGCLLKDTPLEPLASAIRSVHQGYTHLGSGLFEKVLSPLLHSTTPKLVNFPPEFAELTPREKEVLRLIAAGASNREIAKSLYIAERTVKNHVTSILSRLNLREPPVSYACGTPRANGDAARTEEQRLRTQAAIFANSFVSLLDDSLK